MHHTREHSYFFLPIFSGVFVAILLISSITSTKILDIWGLTLDGGTLLFPFSYILSDIITEVYGYRNARKIVWAGLLSLLLFSGSVSLIGMLPADASWGLQSSYDSIFGLTPRIILASIIAYFFGELINSFIIARLKSYYKGKYLLGRLLSSSVFGHGIDSTLFILIAFVGVLSPEILLALILSNFIWKMGTEIVVSPLTLSLIKRVKHSENTDVYDDHLSLRNMFFSKE